MSKAMKVYRFRLKPTKAQAQMLRQFAGARRFLWNWALARRTAHYEATGKTLPRKILSSELPILKKQEETAWLAKMESTSLQQALIDLDLAYAKFFRKEAKFPKFRKKGKSQESFRVACH